MSIDARHRRGSGGHHHAYNDFQILTRNCPPWMELGLCAETDPEAFFPEKGGAHGQAKQVCTGCPVRAECLEYAIENKERFGIWGGLSEVERRPLLKARKEVAA